MANQYGLFWNSENSDRLYDADSFSEWLQKFFTTGVFNGDLQVQASSGMAVTVGTGYANINGKVRFFDTAESITISPASGSYPRIDTIVVERNDTDREITVKYVQGDYNGQNPSPTAPVRSANIYQIVLAQIYVGVGVTEITQANITDTRADTDLCGWVVGTVDEVDVEQMTAQAQAAFDAWFATIQDVLDEDTAGHLQNEIVALDGTETDIVLSSASWANDEYTITNVIIDPNREIILTYPSTLTDAEYQAYKDADIRPYGSITSGSMTLKAVNGAPTIDLPMTILVKGL